MTSRGRLLAVTAACALLATGCLVPYDFDANGKADLAYFRNDGSWFRVGEAEPFFESAGPGAFESAAPGDYDGDGRWEPANVLDDGTWETAGGRGDIGFPDAAPGSLFREVWIPVPANYVGSRATEPAWFSVADATWHIEGLEPIVFGIGADADPVYWDVPVPADYDGDGDDEIAVYRPSDGSFHVQGVGEVAGLLPNSYPAPADYDGDGVDDPAVVGDRAIDVSSEDPTDWVWERVLVVEGEAPVPWSWGTPIPANYNGGPGDEAAGFDGTEVFVEGQAATPLAISEDDAHLTALRPALQLELLRLTFLASCAREGSEVEPQVNGLSC